MIETKALSLSGRVVLESQAERTPPFAGRHNALARLLIGLADRPATLWLALLALNALAQPYAGFVHDARLYGGQALHRAEPDLLADDLYFRFGSQDRFTLFSPLVVPLLRLLGLPLAFAVVYLVGNALFLLAFQRLVLLLVRDRVAAVLALLYVAVVPIPFAGMQVFHVNENFLTPRLPANALVLFALEQLLRGRRLLALILFGPALLLHPLMAFGGLLVYLTYTLSERINLARFATVVALAGAAALTLLLDAPLATRWLGSMDPEWRECVRRANLYNFPAEWFATDWLRIALALAVTLTAARTLPLPAGGARLLIAVAGVGLLGAGASVLVCYLPYALPLQGQPYRALWLLQLAQVPLAFALAVRWWAGPRPERMAPALLGCLSLLSLSDDLMLPLAAALAVWFPLATLLGQRPRRRQLLGLAFAGVAVALIVSASASATEQVGRQWDDLVRRIGPARLPVALPMLFDPLVRLLVGLAVLLTLRGCLRREATFRAALAAILTVLQVTPAVVSESRWYRRTYPVDQIDLAFVADYLRGHPGEAGRPLTVYWPGGRLEYVWFDLHVNSYFYRTQSSGNLFSRPMAVEAQRRADLTRSFEIEDVRHLAMFLDPTTQRTVAALYRTRLADPPPTWADLERVARDEQLDVIVARDAFAGHYAATDGVWYVYDCRDLRASR